MPKTLDKVYLSVIIPSYNEVANIKRGVLNQVVKYLEKQSYAWELLLSDDGSTDTTLKHLKSLAKSNPRIKVLENSHAGKANAVSVAMLLAKGKWRLFTDFDQSTPIESVEKLLEYGKSGYDISIGSREIFGALRDKEPWYRHLMGRVFNILVQALAVPGLLDTQCGFKLYSDKATKQLFPLLVIYGPESVWKDAFTGAFDVELLFLAKRYGFSIREVPIQWVHAHSDRVHPIKDSLRMLRDIIRIRIVAWRGLYPPINNFHDNKE